MSAPLELLYQSGIKTGKVSQIPPSLDGRPDLSRLSELSRPQPSTPTSQPSTPPPITGEQIKSLQWTGERTPASNPQPTSQPSVPSSQPTSQPTASNPVNTGNPNVSGAVQGAASAAATFVGGQVGKAVGDKVAGDAGAMLGEAVGSGIAAAAATGYLTGNPAAATVAGGLTGVGSLTNSALNAAGQALGANTALKRAEQSLSDANKRYELALKNRYSAEKFNTRGSGDGLVSTVGSDPTKNYIVTVYYDGDSVFAGGEFTYTVLGGNIRVENINGQWTLFSGSAPIPFATPNRFPSGGIRNIAREDGTPENPIAGGYIPPLDSPKPKPSPATSPDYFPYLPSLQIGGNAADLLDSQAPRYDNKPPLPFKEPELAPPLAPPLAHNPLYSQPNTNTASSPSSGTSSPSPPSPNTREVNQNATRDDVPPSQAKNPLTNPLIPPPATKPQTTPNTPPFPDLGTIALGVTALGITTGAVLTGVDAIKNKTDKIDNQTRPEAQQANAQQGVCDAMQPQQCGYQGVKQATEEATNPIKETVNENKGILGSIVGNLGILLTLITSNFTKLFNFLDLNAKVESVKSTITLALTLHNALMLSQSLGDTLGVILDNVLNVFGNTFRDSNGNQIGASQYLGATVQQWIINVIGVENYVQLTETLAQANRIYQTGMNILSTVQGVFDAANAAAQATGIKLSLLMNGLRDDGVVSPRAYGHQDESPLGNRASALQRFTQLTTTVSDLDSKAQNLVTITSAPITIRDSVKQSKDDFKAFNDARDSSSEVNKQAKQAKLDLIKELKPITEATIGKRDDDT